MTDRVNGFIKSGVYNNQNNVALTATQTQFISTYNSFTTDGITNITGKDSSTAQMTTGLNYNSSPSTVDYIISKGDTLGTNNLLKISNNGDLTLSDGNTPSNGTTINYVDLAKIDGITNGTAAINKALVLDGSGDLTSGIHDFKIGNDLTVKGDIIGKTGALSVLNIGQSTEKINIGGAATEINIGTDSSQNNTLTIGGGGGDIVKINGSLQVTGTTTTVNSTNISIKDPTIEIGADAVVSDGLDRGIKFKYNNGSAKYGFFGMDNSTNSLRKERFVYLTGATDTGNTFSGNQGTIQADFTTGKLSISNGSITDSDGSISFGSNILSTTGTLSSGALTVSGGAAITGNSTITGTLASGAITSSGALIVSTGGAAITGNSTITGTLASGALTVNSGGAAITGNSTITGTLTSSNALTVSSGGVNITGGIDNNSGGITEAGAISGASTINASGTLTVTNGGAAITGNSTITGTLTATDKLTVNTGGAAITGNSTINGSLSSGAITSTGKVEGTSITDGAATLSGGTLSRANATLTLGNIASTSITLIDDTTASSDANEKITIKNTLGTENESILLYAPKGGIKLVSGDYSVVDIDELTTASSTITSDIRYKENIVPLNNSLEKVLQLRGVHYHWKDKEKFNDKLQMGFIAQEVEEICPELVLTKEDGYKAVNYTQSVSLLVEAIKEQNKLIVQLQEEVQLLKNKPKRTYKKKIDEKSDN